MTATLIARSLGEVLTPTKGKAQGKRELKLTHKRLVKFPPAPTSLARSQTFLAHRSTGIKGVL